MSWLSSATGININLLGKGGAATEIVKTAETAVVNAFTTAAGTVVTELVPNTIHEIETAINGLLVSKGLGATVDEVDALIKKELQGLGILPKS